MQIVIGLLCAADGCPVAVCVFEGSTTDPNTVAGQVEVLQKRFGVRSIALVGDRGLPTPPLRPHRQVDPEHPPDVRVYGRSRPHPRLPVRACLLCRMAHAPTACAPAVRGRRSPTPIAGPSPLDPARVSHRARRKHATGKTEDGHAVHSFRSLLDDLSTLTLNHVSLPGRNAATLPMLANPTLLQNRPFELLEIDPQKLVPGAEAGSARGK